MKKYWKVVRNVGGKRYSCIVVAINKKTVHCREYPTGFFTQPAPSAAKRGYLLTCFNKKAAALDFVKDLRGWCRDPGKQLEVWEADAIGVSKKLPRFADLNRNIFVEAGWGWPDHTVMAEKIKLVRRVK